MAAPKGDAATLMTSVLPVEIFTDKGYAYWPNPSGLLMLPLLQEFHGNTDTVYHSYKTP